MVAIVRKLNRYGALIAEFPLRPIRSERELDRATAIVDRLSVQSSLSKDESDYLEVLADLIEKYEDLHHPIEPLPDAEMLAFLIEQKGLAQQVVARQARIANSTISEILWGKRRLTRGQIEKLSKYFDVAPSVFLAGSE